MSEHHLKQLNVIHKSFIINLKCVLQSTIKQILQKRNSFVIKIHPKNIKSNLLFFKNHSLCCYQQLIEIAVEDQPAKRNRFRINYVLSSLIYSHRIIISLTSNELDYLPSVTKLYASAGWLEREVWDLYGIFFKDNTDLKRILTDYGFKGHPLRKDFPLTGFFELYYSLNDKRILSEPVELSQEYRVFST